MKKNWKKNFKPIMYDKEAKIIFWFVYLNLPQVLFTTNFTKEI